MYIIASKWKSTFGTIGNATVHKMTAKVIGRNLELLLFHKELNWRCGHASKHACKTENILLLKGFLRLILNENLFLLNLLSHFFRLVPFLEGSSGLQITNRQAPVTLSGQTCFCSDTTHFWLVKLKQLNSCNSEPRLHGKPFWTK